MAAIVGSGSGKPEHTLLQKLVFMISPISHLTFCRKYAIITKYVNLNGTEMKAMNTRQDWALPEGTQLLTYRILQTLEVCDAGIVYLAVQPEQGTLCRILECFPPGLVRRMGREVTAEDMEGFAVQKKLFLQRADLLFEMTVSFCPAVMDVAEAFGTAYCIMAYSETKPLFQCSIPVTAGYVRSLGIMLCDMYEQLHKLDIPLPSPRSLGLSASGSLWLDASVLFADMSAPEPARDLHALTSYLTRLLPDEEEGEEAEYVRRVLSLLHPSAAALRAALIGESKAGISRWKTVFCTAACLLFLAGAGIVCAKIIKNSGSLRQMVEKGKIEPATLEVWVPLADTAHEEDTVAMYERLSQGFIQQYPELDVHVTLYADNAFEEALESGEGDVFMDSTLPAVMDRAADLSPLIESIEGEYFTDFTDFNTTLPLGCSFPAAFYHIHAGNVPEQSTVTLQETGTLFGWDSRAGEASADLDVRIDGDVFSDFLQDPAQDLPVIAATAQLVQAENTPGAGGDVKMLPLYIEGTCPMQYELYCTVNKKQDMNTQRIGMLWLRYLLTEEAQHILFVEHFGALPLEKNTFAQAVQTHDALKAIGEMQGVPNEEEQGVDP